MLPETIVFVTSTNLATNPRCVKEIQLALQHGIQVKVMACKLGGWSQKNEALLQQSLHGIEIKYADATRGDKLNWLRSALIEKCSLFLYKLFDSKALQVIANAEGRRNYILLKELNKTDWKPSLVIAHNPAAFYPAWVFAKNRKAFYAIDVEDYHPGENRPWIKQQLAKQLMQGLLPQVDYASYASPLILKKIKEEIKHIDTQRNFVINNLFLKHEFSTPLPTVTDHLKFVWFSQNIDYGRGLEKTLEALDSLVIPFTLTLIGNARESFVNNEVSHRKYIHVINPLPQPDLHKYLSNFDIGLAVEDSQADGNRALCLTNKLWAYFQAGLYIIATDTAAQKEFMHQFPRHGVLVKDDHHSYTTIFKEVVEAWTRLNQLKEERFTSAQAHSWDKESEKLAKVWSEIIQ